MYRCRHCAEVVKEKVSKMENVQEAELNFLNKTMKIILKKNSDKDEELKKIIFTINKVEANTKISEKTVLKQKIILDVSGLTCGHCAEVIEDKLNDMSYIKEANLNFLNKTLSINFNKNINKREELKNIAKIIQNIDKNVSITENVKNKPIIEEKETTKFWLAKIGVGSILFLLGVIFDNLPIFFASYAILGYDVIFKALRNIVRGRVFDENFLMSIATIGAFFIRKYAEGLPLCYFTKSVNFFKKKLSASLETL